MDDNTPGGRAIDGVLRLLDRLTAGDRQDHLLDVVRRGDISQSSFVLEELQSVVNRSLRSLREHLAAHVAYRLGCGLHLDGPDDEGELLWCTRAFVVALASSGEVGRINAARVVQRESQAWSSARGAPSGADPWSFWLREGDLETYEFLHLLVSSVWFDIVEPRLSNRPRAKAPALSAKVLMSLLDAFWRRDRRIALDDGRHVVVNRGRRVALVDESGINDDELKASRTLASQRLLRFLVGEGYRQRVLGVADYERLTLRGGFSSLAQRLGMNGAKAAAQLRASMVSFQSLHIPLPDGSNGRLLTWESRPAAPGRPSEVSVVLGAPLLPEYVNAIVGNGLDARRARQLVPIPATFPPFIGHPQFHGAQAVLQLVILRHFRLHAVELVTTGSVRTDSDQWRRLAEEAGVPESILAELLATWSAPGPEPFLLRNGDGFTLASGFEDALDTIREGGKQQVEGRTRQARGRRRGRQ